MLHANWLRDENGKLYSKWVTTEDNFSDISDNELRTRVLGLRKLEAKWSRDENGKLYMEWKENAKQNG
jgi:hypothetical protein